MFLGAHVSIFIVPRVSNFQSLMNIERALESRTLLHEDLASTGTQKIETFWKSRMVNLDEVSKNDERRD